MADVVSKNGTAIGLVSCVPPIKGGVCSSSSIWTGPCGYITEEDGQKQLRVTSKASSSKVTGFLLALSGLALGTQTLRCESAQVHIRVLDDSQLQPSDTWGSDSSPGLSATPADTKRSSRCPRRARTKLQISAQSKCCLHFKPQNLKCFFKVAIYN